MTAPVPAAELARRAEITARLLGRDSGALVNEARDLGAITSREADAVHQALAFEHRPLWCRACRTKHCSAVTR